jgi:hypothetical protein
MKVLLILFAAILLICENCFAQRNVTIYGGLKFIEYRGSNIWFYYHDESPAPDDFYTDIEIEWEDNFQFRI